MADIGEREKKEIIKIEPLEHPNPNKRPQPEKAPEPIKVPEREPEFV